ncbi:MAG: tetratricopeptide repeat protein, partial [Planctomycetota bacterium]
LGDSDALALAEDVQEMQDPSWIGLILANRSLREKDITGALQRLETLRSTVPASNTSAHIQIERLTGLAMLQNGDYSGAKDAYLRLLDTDPDNIEVLNNLAYILSTHLDDPEAALPLAKQAADRAPDSAEILDTLGWTYYSVGDTENARATLERSVQAREIPANTLHLGRIYLETGNSRRARQLLERSIELSEQAGDDETADLARGFLKQL